MIVWQDMTAEDRKEVTRIVRKLDRVERQLERQRFVDKHQLACFKCGSSYNAWATAKETNGRPWALCLPCARKPREPQTTPNGSY